MTTYLEQSTTGVWDVPASFLPNVYIEAITRAGGTVVLLPPQPSSTAVAHRVLAGLDALVLTGGKDIESARYGQTPHPDSDEPRPDRDAWEFDLLEGALDRDLPVLGICRGAQVLNVLRGGTLHQHLPDIVGDDRYQRGGGIFSQAEVSVQEETALAGIVGPRVAVKLYHHQAVDRLGDGLVASAHTSDGIVEAVELPGASFVVAVQWHPEEDLDDLRLFEAVVEAARVGADRRADDRRTTEGVPA
ncbi:gamma-glutamyl-gamma-aminobutyrate hydrolase family protein [Labedella phragmitis]|uniref:Gamma-glutamyl-gamma-aminobutyrate hydrolase family protein n=1 Tax=Labedella phragmitis TaxID=2498849 RepID=A0A444PPQ4_9MICO|nr:gamma-glutamyl-gamma-aminobutyrate hydrolase family protein [Labedella phragmitis]RWZ46395.1 gamma-glutamyl-gamma-aminobutyrate hydrolase family protein [Labedella phragmitis]